MCELTFTDAVRLAREFERDLTEHEAALVAKIIVGAQKATPIGVAEFEAADA